MRYLLLSTILLLNGVSFSQNLANNVNFEYYMGDTYVGMRINPVLTSLKGKIPNQEIDINFTLYYQNKYTLSNNQVLGFVEGRLISETPLSSYDPLEKIRKDNSLAVSNYASQVKEYQQVLSNFQQFQKMFDSEIYEEEIYEEIYEEEIEKEESVSSDVNNEVQEEGLIEQDYEDESYENDTSNEEELVTSLQYINQDVLAQSIDYSTLIDENMLSLPAFPSITYTNANPSKKTLSAKELEFLVRYEKLRASYNEAIRLYNQAILEDESTYKDYFDPADPAEEFTIMFVGDQQNLIWSKKFGLDGIKNYQSHNNVVWYLGYQLALTKKDLRILYNIFNNSANVRYFVKGANGTLNFNLSSYFIVAMKELVDLYVRGKFVIDDNTKYPIMRTY